MRGSYASRGASVATEEAAGAEAPAQFASQRGVRPTPPAAGDWVSLSRAKPIRASPASDRHEPASLSCRPIQKIDQLRGARFQAEYVMAVRFSAPHGVFMVTDYPRQVLRIRLAEQLDPQGVPEFPTL